MCSTASRVERMFSTGMEKKPSLWPWPGSRMSTVMMRSTPHTSSMMATSAADTGKAMRPARPAGSASAPA